MCPRCEGMGSVSDFDLTALYDESKSLAEGALTVPGYSMDGWYGRHLQRRRARHGQADREVHQEGAGDLLYAEPTKIKVEGINLTYEGLIPKIQKSMLSKDVEAMQPHVRRFVERAITFTTCPDCDGTRLTKEARSSKINGQEHRRRVRDADQRPRRLGPRARRAVGGAAAHRAAAPARLVRRDRAGLPRRSTGRPARCPGGEAQRTKMIRHLGSSLTDVTYVFDEPTIGLHPHDIERMNAAAAAAARQGQHRARRRAQARDDRDRRPRRRPRPRRRHRRRHGLLRGHRRGAAGERHHHRPPPRRPGHAQGVGAVVRPAPWRSAARRRTTCRTSTSTSRSACSCVLTGVAGSGKSSLIHGSVAGRDGVVVIDQGAIKGSRRSNPATYTGLLEPIRKAFAKANGVKPALFSSNSEGACPACNGAGRHLHRAGRDGHRRVHLRGVRGQAVPGVRCSSTRSAAGTSPRCSRCR